MSRRPLIAWLALAQGLLATALPAAEIQDFAGRWEADGVTGAAPPALGPADLGFELEPASGGGFIARWTSLEPTGDGVRGEAVEARFAPTERPGVYAFRQDSSLLASLFASPETGNPLAGDRLLWARLEGDTLILYSLALDRRGRFRLHRYAHTLDQEALEVVQTVRTGTAEPLMIEGRLTAASP